MTTAVVHHGDCLEVLRTMPSNSFDGLLSDPPAGIGFMGKSWDKDKGGRDQWIAWLASVMREACRVMKPGAYGLVWALPRTAHWTTMALEDAGFEVRDVVLHLFGSGFPKSLDVSKAVDAAAGAVREVVGSRVLTGNAAVATADKGGTYGVQAGTAPAKTVAVTTPATDLAREWQGYGSALKPAAEHWILVRKPLDGTVAANVAKWGTGGIAIDGCRVGELGGTKGTDFAGTGLLGIGGKATIVALDLGRWPANVTLDPEAAAMLDAQAGDRPGMSGGGTGARDRSMFGVGGVANPETVRADNGGPSRFFYVAKATTFERNFGCEALPVRTAAERVDRADDSAGMDSPRAGAGRTGGAKNHHPTIKSISLTKWLATLIKPPGDGKRLICPFAGSGGEVIGAMRAGWGHVEGIEQDPDFVAIARARIQRWSEVAMHLEPDEVEQRSEDERQLSLIKKESA